MSDSSDFAASLPLYFFNQISRYPRQSKKEERVRRFICQWADAHGYHTTVDRCGNCIIAVPASKGHEQRPPLALQAHLDMVCEVTPGHRHNFSTDPIIPQYADGWVRAPHTTLGADNGIGIALALALCDDPLVERPPLELVFTVDEETGLTGAAGLVPDAMQAKHLLNLDSEDDAVLINGCAGGVNIYFTKEYRLAAKRHTAARRDRQAFRFELTGFPGGHSGVDINKPFGNALCCGVQMLERLMTDVPHRCSVGALQSGTVHNAIPRDFTAYLFLAADACSMAESIMNDQLQRYVAASGLESDGIHFTLTESDKRMWARSPESSAALLSFVSGLPHGVASFTANPAIPQTSSNVACVASAHGRDSILVSVRSSDARELERSAADLAAYAAAHDATCSRSGEYPVWHPQPHSRLLEQCQQAYLQTHGASPRVEVIHAGLEPAVIAHIVPDLDMLSCGPLILNPHSPQERLSIQSTAQLYRMLITLLRDW